jgi:hypothetical protein
MTQQEKGPIAIKAKCKRCKYEWNTLSQAYYVSCPRCLTKVQIRKFIFIPSQNEK